MNIKLSEHAEQRMLERGISKDEVKRIFDEENFEYFANSKDDPSAVVVDKTLNGKKWRFVFNKFTNTLITCFPRR